MLWAVSRAPLAKLKAFKKRMGWTFPWASSLGDDFNFDFNVSITEEQQREGGGEYNYRGGGHAMVDNAPGARPPECGVTGTDAATYVRERPGMSAFALEDSVVYHTYSTYARGLDARAIRVTVLDPAYNARAASWRPVGDSNPCYQRERLVS